MHKWLLLIGLLMCFGYSSLAQVDEYVQEPEQKYAMVYLKNGKHHSGRVISQTNREILLETNDGVRITIDMKNVKNITYKLDFDSPTVSYHNLQSTRYFFGPNGFGLRKGEGYYQNVLVFYNQASYGVTDYFSIGGGMVPLFLFDGAPTPVWITPKFSVPVKEDLLNVGVGGLFGTVIGAGEGATFGIGYGAFTLGNRDLNFNFSVGYGMAGGQWSQDATISISGMARLGSKFYLISENYYLPNADISFFSNRGPLAIRWH
ncbi:MAG: hypothetical protein U5L96_13995 [Owenweeksia sp.]|nr:hypothetical protein [Owenweeksia sp.]